MSIVLFALIATAPAGGWFNDPVGKIQHAVDLQDLRALDSVTGGHYRIKAGTLEYNIGGSEALKMLKGCNGKAVDEPTLNTLGRILWTCEDHPSEVNQCLDIGYQATLEPMKDGYLLWLSRWDRPSKKRCEANQN